MSAGSEHQPNIYISQFPRFPEQAMHDAQEYKREYALQKIGVELMPFRFSNANYLAGLKQTYGVDVAVAGVTTATYPGYARDMRDLGKNPRVAAEIVANIALIGAQDEPAWTRTFHSHLDLAITLGATYLAMHEEPTRWLINRNQLERWTSTTTLYGRKLGWGPEDHRPQVLSWDIYAIADFISAWKEKTNGNIGTILPTDTALRDGYTTKDGERKISLLQAWEVLQPRVIQFGDYAPSGKREKLAPGSGVYSGLLAEIVQESTHVNPDTIYTVEVNNPKDVRTSIEFILQNTRG